MRYCTSRPSGEHFHDIHQQNILPLKHSFSPLDGLIAPDVSREVSVILITDAMELLIR